MSVEFTKQQQRVIDLRNCNILVSAAAGSGKTAVLTERIVNMICDETNPVDVDRLLVVTFTGAAAAERGHDVVMSPGNACYLDKAQGLNGDKYQYIGGNIPLSVCYGFDPSAGVSAKAAKHILGGQGNNWTEYTWNREELEWKMWPRMLALSEVFWLGEKKPGFEDFKRRAAVQREALIKSGVNCAPLK